MTGRERMEAAFSEEGARELPVANSYPRVFERDHYAELTNIPWWHLYEVSTSRRARLIESLNMATDFDWFLLPRGFSAEEQKHIRIVEESDGVYRVDDRTGIREKLSPPVRGGSQRVMREDAPQIDDLEKFLADTVRQEDSFTGLKPGQADLPQRLMASLGKRKYPIMLVLSPLWDVGSSGIGYEQWLTFFASAPDVIFEAARRCLHNAIQRVKEAAAMGCRGILVEDCMADMIGPERFARYNFPLLKELIEAIRAAGMQSIYYYFGNPWPMWDLIMASGADALALEESKKGITIDLSEVVERVQGRMTVLGNLDAYGILEKGSLEKLRAEIKRQVEAGKRNNNRFILCTGSPITPDTTVERVRDYIAMARELWVS